MDVLIAMRPKSSSACSELALQQVVEHDVTSLMFEKKLLTLVRTNCGRTER